MDILAGTPVAVRIDLLGPQGQLLEPDVGSVTYSVFDTSGGLIVDQAPLLPPEGATGVIVPLSSSQTQITLGRRFERRMVWVFWKTEGWSCQRGQGYRVVPFTTHTVTPASVRSYAGISEDELPDDEVDVFRAFLEVEAEVGPEVLTEALLSGTLRSVRANEAIALSALLTLLPGLRQRVAQSTTDGNLRFDRMKDAIDFDQLAREAREARSRALAAVTGSSTATAPLLVLVATTVDAITGS